MAAAARRLGWRLCFRPQRCGNRSSTTVARSSSEIGELQRECRVPGFGGSICGAAGRGIPSLNQPPGLFPRRGSSTSAAEVETSEKPGPDLPEAFEKQQQGSRLPEFKASQLQSSALDEELAKVAAAAEAGSATEAAATEAEAGSATDGAAAAEAVAEETEAAVVVPPPTPPDELAQCVESIRSSASKLRSSLIAMGGTQLIGALYLWYTEDMAESGSAFFVRFTIFSLVVPFSMARFLPTSKDFVRRNVRAAGMIQTLKLISSYFRRSDLVVGLAALALLVATLYETCYPYISGFIVETGNKIQKTAREDVERLKEIKQQQQQ